MRTGLVWWVQGFGTLLYLHVLLEVMCAGGEWRVGVVGMGTARMEWSGDDGVK
jgi:hypothetical protein